MLIYLVEPYYTGSHKDWAQGLIDNSKHEILLFQMPGRFWKWRMQGSAVTIAEQINAEKRKPELILCSGMIDLACFRSLIKFKDVKITLYMHENQLTYPISQYSKDVYQEVAYGYLNYKSCLCADFVIFNSQYHQEKFLEACQILLQKMPDHKNLKSIETIRSKSSIIPVGMNKNRIDDFRKNNPITSQDYPTLLWNHRWEHDKNPELFLRLVRDLAIKGLEFGLNITNVSSPKVIGQLQVEFGQYIRFVGYCNSYDEYLALILQSDILPVTSNHDFFGISVLEAMYLDCIPLLPKHLCYQEHFTQPKEELFYDSYDELFQKTTSLLSSHNQTDSQIEGLPIKDYNWKHVITQYDKFLDNIN